MTTKRITRNDPATIKGGIVSGVDKAGFISLVGTPANQRAFSILRSDKEENEVSNTTTRVKRTRRNDSHNLVKLTFPEAYTSEQAEASLETFGLTGFTLVDQEGTLCASRSDLQTIANGQTTSIKLTEDGIMADVLVPEGSEVSSGKNGLAVPYIEFSSDTFSRADVVSWLEENKVDFDEKAIDNSTGNFVLKRADVDAETEVRQMALGEGVTAAVVRADSSDIPEGYVQIISEAAYCGWGWGQMDFEARLADIEVGDKIREGLYAMEDVLRNIIFHSELPVESRKLLTNRTLAQYGAYVSNLLDLLPRQLLVSVSGSVSTQRKDKAQEPDMTVTTGTTQSTSPEDEVISIKRSDLKAMIADAIVEHDAAGNATAAAPEATTTTTEEAKPATAGLTRADLQELLAPVIQRMEKIEGTTIVRSDSGDAPNVAAEQEAAEEDTRSESIKRADSVFGSLNLFGRAPQ